MTSDIRPVLVTGVPRSGTTWLARQLASAGGAAMTGREPMNTHRGQFALGGTITGWTRLMHPEPAHARVLRRVYRGWAPRAYGRYGHRQWAAAWPSTRVVVKDPFAMLSISAVHRVTGALPVLVYRHPGAVLASFRRMGWSPDLAGVIAALNENPASGVSGSDFPAGDPPTDPAADPITAAAWFWATVNTVALQDLSSIPHPVVVSHQELTVGGDPAMQRLFEACGFRGDQPVRTAARRVSKTRVNASGKTLHQLDRSPAEIADGWRVGISPDELAVIDRIAGPTFEALQARRLRVGNDVQQATAQRT